MTNNSQSVKDQKTSISPMLSVRNGAKAVEFYKAAFPPHPAKTAPYGDPALRSTRISAPSRWALSFGEAPRCGWWWSWQIRMPLSHAPSKQEPPWFGPSFFGQSTFGQSTTRHMVGTSDELSIPSDITGNRQAFGRRPQRVWVYFPGLDLISQSGHPDCLSKTALG